MSAAVEIQPLKKTPLYDRHVAAGGKIVNFSGWALPVYYSSVLEEHLWTRCSSSVFDVSHLGEIHVKGPGAFGFLQSRLTNDMRKLNDGAILYNLLCDPKGGALDDILIYRSRPDDYYLLVNAGSLEGDLEALRIGADEDGVVLTNCSDVMACLAVQGPRSEEILERIFGFRLRALDYYRFREESFSGRIVWISRSGYTGEDGFEIFSENALGVSVWDRLMDAGLKEGVRPAGLGARNTLRLEAGNVLYGNDLDGLTTPLEAGLGWAVSFTKGDFTGRAALLKQKEKGIARCLVGFKVSDKSIPREHYPIYARGRQVGRVTSGSFGPSVGCGIGLGYVEKGFELPGTRIDIEIHGRLSPAEVARLPFVGLKHKKK